MTSINRIKDGIIVEWGDRQITLPLNSTYAMVDESDMVLFKPIGNIKQVLFFSLIKDIRIDGKRVTRSNVIQEFNALSNAVAEGGTVSGDITIDTTVLEEKLDKVIDYTKTLDTAMGDVLNGCEVGGYITDDGVKIIEEMTCN